MTQRLNSYFRSSPELRQLSGKAGQLLALQRQYEKLVPAALGRHSHVLQLEQHTLILAANNSAIAAKLRQLVPELTRQFCNTGCEITGIQVKVQVVTPDLKRVSRSATLGAEGCKRLLELADKLPASPLKNALRHLVRKSGP